MTTFILDTDSVDAAKSSIDSLKGQIDTLTSSVNSYDTSSEEFDFSGPKGVIAGNIEALGVKIQNTSAMIESVVASHSTLQNGMKFMSSEEKAAQAKKNSTASTGTSTYYSSSSGNTGSYYAAPAAVSYSAQSSPSTSSKVVETTPEVTPTITEIKEKIEKIDIVKVDKDKLTEEALDFLERVNYNDSGFALYGGMYLIACTTGIGKVGDIIEFTLKDGSKMRCLVLENTEDTGEVKFFINDQYNEDNITKDLVDNIEKGENYGNFTNNTGLIDLTKLPKIGENTKELEKLNDKWVVATTKVSPEDYEKVVANKQITQNSDKEKYSDYCLAFSYVHASNMYNGDTAVDAGKYKHAAEFSDFKSDNKGDTLLKIYSEIVKGKPVVMQVNGNTAGTSRHFVTVVGFRESVTDPLQLTEKDLLIMDSWDGKIERMDQEKSRFMTTGKQTGKDYTGYYLRTLKDKA